MKQSNPVHIFGAIVFFSVLVLVVWLLIPWFNKDSNPLSVSDQHQVTPDSLPCFLVLSDIHLHNSLTQENIPNRAADSGHDLWDTTLNKIKNILAGTSGFKKPEFIIVLGDLPWHADANNRDNLESAHDNSGVVLHDLRTLVENAGLHLIYVPGNNDPWDGDYHSFSTKIFAKDTGCKTCWPYINPRSDDSVILQSENIDTTELQIGCYSVFPLGRKSKLKVVVLNSTMFVNNYMDVKDNQQNYITEQMRWFTEQLEHAEAENESVLIAMHVPPGLDGYKKKDFWKKTITYNGTSLQNAFLDLLDKYQNHIIGILSSHTHMDGLRKLYNRNGKLIAVDISVPGIAPGHGNNPGMKLISYRPDNYELQNFTTLYENFFPAQKVVSWGSDAFDFRTEFGCPPGTSIRVCLDTLNREALQNAIQSIYLVKHGKGKVDEVNPAIDVRYE